VHESTVDGTAAAMKAAGFIGQGEYETSPLIPEVVGACDGCGECVDVCAYGAITLTDEGPRVDPLSCAGCGVCIGACKQQALELAHYTRKQLRAEVQGLLSRETEEVRLVGFFEDSVCYRTADTAGTSRLKYLPNLEIIRVPSPAMLSEDFLLECLRLGADAVLLCEKEGREAEFVSSVVERVREKLERAGVEKERIAFQTLMMPMYLYLPKLIESHVRKIKSLGKLKAESKQKLAELIEGEK
jgi:heterodisulfide reductase subunit A